MYFLAPVIHVATNVTKSAEFSIPLYRWSAYLNSKPSSLKEYLAEYPLLKKSTFVCMNELRMYYLHVYA